MTEFDFTPVRQETRSDGRITYYSAAHEAMQNLETAYHRLTRLEVQLRELQGTVFQAREDYKSALDKLERELANMYGDALPEAFEMPFGVLVMDDPERSPRLLRRRSWADTFHIEDPVEEAA